EVRGMGEVHEDLVVKLSYVIDGLVERDVQRLATAHGIVKSDPDEEGGFADTMAGNDDADVPAAKSAVDRVFEQSQRVAFVEFLAIHMATPRLFFVCGDQAGAVLLDQLQMNFRRNRGIA